MVQSRSILPPCTSLIGDSHEIIAAHHDQLLTMCRPCLQVPACDGALASAGVHEQCKRSTRQMGVKMTTQNDVFETDMLPQGEWIDADLFKGILEDLPSVTTTAPVGKIPVPVTAEAKVNSAPARPQAEQEKPQTVSQPPTIMLHGEGRLSVKRTLRGEFKVAFHMWGNGIMATGQGITPARTTPTVNLWTLLRALIGLASRHARPA